MCDVDASRMSFDEGKLRLVDLLAQVGWRRQIAWVDHSRITSFPQRVFVYLPHGKFELEHAIRAEYEAALARYPAVRLGAVGIAGGLTLATVWPIRELGQGEEMFIDHGVKVNVPTQKTRVTITRSRLRWWLIRRAYREWIERRDAALRTG